LLFADEVMTGFGRTGLSGNGGIFGCDRENVSPDLMAVAKGLTGGYLPMGATLCSQEIFDAFLGEYADFKTFFHGHSYSGNQLGAAAGLASLKLLSSSASLKARRLLEVALKQSLERLWCLPQVGDIRQSGLIVGIELVENWRTRKPYSLSAQAGIRVCENLARRGVLTRPIGNVIVLMPPYCTTPKEIEDAIGNLILAIRKTL
jgi:adenosylmethionine-8-amino-7-oxononanoate aminotransferase